MTAADDARRPKVPFPGGSAGPAVPADHAGSVLCRLLAHHPEVMDIEVLGQTQMPGGAISYSLGIMLPGGRELYVDVEDAGLTC